jgi:anti-sigma regulatory factor (Ser/Thr protein kinase)
MTDIVEDDGTHRELQIDAVGDNAALAIDFVTSCMESLSHQERSEVEMSIAVDEIFSNVAYYAYGENVGVVTIAVDINEDERAVSVAFIDEGLAYDPLGATDPDILLSDDERTVGGYGIFLVKKIMDEVTYRRAGNKNILTVTKHV